MNVTFYFLPMKRTAPTAWLLQFSFGMCSRSLPSVRPRAGEVAASISRSLRADSQDHPTCSPGLRPTPTPSADALCIGWGNRQACPANQCRSRQHILGIGLRPVTRAIHEPRCMRSCPVQAVAQQGKEKVKE
jgi:hypothetical protein